MQPCDEFEYNSYTDCISFYKLFIMYWCDPVCRRENVHLETYVMIYYYPESTTSSESRQPHSIV